MHLARLGEHDQLQDGCGFVEKRHGYLRDVGPGGGELLDRLAHRGGDARVGLLEERADDADAHAVQPRASSRR